MIFFTWKCGVVCISATRNYFVRRAGRADVPVRRSEQSSWHQTRRKVKSFRDPSSSASNQNLLLSHNSSFTFERKRSIIYQLHNSTAIQEDKHYHAQEAEICKETKEPPNRRRGCGAYRRCRRGEWRTRSDRSIDSSFDCRLIEVMSSEFCQEDICCFV